MFSLPACESLASQSGSSGHGEADGGPTGSAGLSGSAVLGEERSESPDLSDESGESGTGRDAMDLVIAHGDLAVRSKLVGVAKSLGHSVRDECEDVPSLHKACTPTPPDLIMSGLEMAGGDVVETLIEISENDPTPAIVVTPKDSLSSVEKALRDHVMAYLVEPIDEEQIKPTIYLVCERFKQFELLKAENDDLRQTLVDRKSIERAKGILMGQEDITEEEAFRRLQKLAQSKRMKLAKIAAVINDVTDQQAK